MFDGGAKSLPPGILAKMLENPVEFRHLIPAEILTLQARR
jgi:hypothetical protein